MSGKVVRPRTSSRLGWTRLAVVAILILITILLASFAALTKPSRAYAAVGSASPSVAVSDSGLEVQAAGVIAG